MEKKVFLQNLVQVQDNKAKIVIDGYIGDVLWGDEISMQEIRNDIGKIVGAGYDKVTFEVTSYGGDVNHALSITEMISQLNEMGVDTHTHYSGFNASAATIIGMVTKTNSISEFGFFLIHKPMNVAVGNENEQEVNLEMLKKVTNTLKEIYIKKGVDGNIVDTLMDQDNGNGIWLNAEEAVEYGFIDKIVPLKIEDKVENMVTEKVIARIDKLGLPTNSLERFLPQEEEEKKTFIDKIKQKLNLNKEKISEEDMKQLEELSAKLDTLTDILSSFVENSEYRTGTKKVEQPEVEETETDEEEVEVEETEVEQPEVEEVPETEEAQTEEEVEADEEEVETEEETDQEDETEDSVEADTKVLELQNQIKELNEKLATLEDSIKNKDERIKKLESEPLSEPYYTDSKTKEEPKEETEKERRLRVFNELRNRKK